MLLPAPCLRSLTACRAPAPLLAASSEPAVLGRLALFGGACGPLVDAVHNQVLLAYDVLPLAVADVRTSWLIPPLLALTYALLGGVLADGARAVLGDATVVASPLQRLPARRRALLAVATTLVIIKASELLSLSSLPASGSSLLLLAACALQWAALDGGLATMALALLVGVGGPLAELPFLKLGAWHYLSPDYFPLEPWGLGPASWAGLSGITGPCYVAVTTDAVALGRWLSGPEEQAG